MNDKSQLNNNANSNNNLKITATSSNTPTTQIPNKTNQIKSLLQQQKLQQQQEQTTPVKNEKEILIQRVSSNQEQQPQQNGTKLKATNNETSPTLKLTSNGEILSPSINNSNLIQPSTSKNITSISTTSNNNNLENKSKLGKSNVRTSTQSYVQVPQFHFPNGRLEEKQFKTMEDIDTWKMIGIEFKQHKEGKIIREDFGEVVKLLGLPIYWKNLLFRSCVLTSKANYVTYPVLEQVWSK